MKERFRSEFLAAASGGFSIEQVNSLDFILSNVLKNYELSVACTDLAIRETLPNCLNVYLATKKIEGLSDKTISQYFIKLRMFFLRVAKPVQDITTNDVRLYLYERQSTGNICTRTLDTERGIICTFFKWAAAEGYVSVDICSQIKKIKYVPRERESLTEMEMEQLRSGCRSKRDKAMVEFFYSTACRVSELAVVKKNDINANGDVILFGKGSKYRTTFLNAKAKLALKEYYESRNDENSYVFVSERKPYHAIKKNAIEGALKKIAKRANIERDIYPHIIRHTTATLAMSRGMDITEIQKMLGHCNISTTLIYAKKDLSSVKLAHERCVV